MKNGIRSAIVAAIPFCLLFVASQTSAATLPPPSCMTSVKARAMDKGLEAIFQKLSAMDEEVAMKKTEGVLVALAWLADGKYAKNQKMLCSISYIDSKLRAYKEGLAMGNDDAALLSAVSSAAAWTSGTSGNPPSAGTSGPSGSAAWTSGGTAPGQEPKYCTGQLPSGEGIVSRPYTEFVAGGDSNTTWGYAQNGGRCTWGCKTGYAADPTKTKCVKRSAGSGITVFVYDSSGIPLPGASVEIIGSLGISTYTVANLTTDASGKTPENFDEGGTVGNILKITKTGYAISYASGCSSRVTKGNSYCDGVSMRDSVVKVYFSPTSGNSGLPTCGSDWEKIGTFSCDAQKRQVQTITSCLPPLYDNPAYWNWAKNPDTFSHLTGKSCQ